MDITIGTDDLADYVSAQCNYFFPDKETIDVNKYLRPSFDYGLERLEYCFSHINYRGYGDGRKAFFNHLYSDQYLQFLYYFGNSIWQLQPEYENVCRKLMLLNRSLNACWFSYKCQLPRVFFIAHPVGTILGNASYGEYAVFMQNVTINNRDTSTIGDFLFMATGSSIIGDMRIGHDVAVGVNATAYKRQIDDNILVYRNEKGALVEKKNYSSPARNYFYIE